MLDKMKAMKQALDFQKSLKKKFVVAKSNDGKVKIKANGLQEIQKVKVDDDLLNEDSKKILEQDIKEAFSSLQNEMKSIMKDEMPNLGGLFG